MPYICEWLVPKRVIYNAISETLTLDEMMGIDHDWTLMLSEIERLPGQSVHGIWDLSEAQKLPSLFDIRKNLRFASDPRIGWGIFIGVHDPMLRVLLNIALQLFVVRFRHFSHMDDGLAYLQSIDPTLPDLKPYFETLQKNL